MDRAKLGSETAKGGFANELDIINKFNNWRDDEEAKKWLEIMGYALKSIKNIEAIQIPTRIKKADFHKYSITDEDYNVLTKYKKADAQVKLLIHIGNIIKVENISIKKANSNADYNQIDKRPVSTYQEMWGFNDDIKLYLQLFTGEKKPIKHKDILDVTCLKEKDKRIFLNEIPIDKQKSIIKFFTDNKILIISDILKGRGGLSANWILVTKQDLVNNSTSWCLVDINIAMNFWGQGEVIVSPRGSLYIGKITMQRKGGTPDPESLQFKFSPCDIFNYNN